VNAKYASVERQVKVSAKKIRLNLECDELWSFVDHKGNKVWLAMDRKQEKLLEFILGNEAKKAKKTCGISTSCISTMCCLLYRFWEPSACILPTRKRVGKDSGLTNHIEI